MDAESVSQGLPIRAYRVDYEAGAESGRVTLRTDARRTDALATQAQAVLEAQGVEAAIRWIMPVEDRPPVAAPEACGRG